MNYYICGPNINFALPILHMSKHLQRIQSNIEPLRQQIVNHKIYTVLKSLEHLHIFMKYHVYAVWDFMSLLKSLQLNLTCTNVPWFPVGSANTRYLINEIVAGEESDIDEFGVRKSHFELYLEAMSQCGANLSQIEGFLKVLRDAGDFEQAYKQSGTPLAAEQFVNFTFDVITNKKIHLQASAFTFGREDLIPSMFFTMITEFDLKFPGQLSVFKYYLNRHIEVDGDHHSNLALEMLSSLCGEDEAQWNDAETIAIKSLERRIALWDGVYNEIVNLSTL
jgi:hypothetical protein